MLHHQKHLHNHLLGITLMMNNILLLLSLSSSSCSVLPPIISSSSSSAFDYKFDPSTAVISSDSEAVGPVEGRSESSVYHNSSYFSVPRSRVGRVCRYCSLCSCSQPSDEDGLQFSSWILRYLYTPPPPLVITQATPVTVTITTLPTITRRKENSRVREQSRKSSGKRRKFARRRKMRRKSNKKIKKNKHAAKSKFILD